MAKTKKKRKRRMPAALRKFWAGRKRKRRTSRAAPPSGRRSRRSPGGHSRRAGRRRGSSSGGFLGKLGGGGFLSRAARALPRLGRAAVAVIGGAAISGVARRATVGIHKNNPYAEASVSFGLAAGTAVAAKPIAKAIPVVKTSDVQLAAVGMAGDGAFVATQKARTSPLAARVGIPGNRKGVLAGDGSWARGGDSGSDIAGELAL